MKKRHHYRILFILMAAGLLCSCGTVGEKEEPQTAGTQTEKAEKEDVRLAPYQSVELAAIARAYYLKENNYLAPEVECLKNDDGTTTLHLYEIVKDDDESSHTATSAGSTVDEYGKGEDDIMGNAVKFPGMSLGEIAEYVKTPIALTYNEEGETHNEWKITDAATMNACIQAISQINVGEETELRTMDAGETLVFQMADGNTWTLDFEAGNLLRNNTCYETDGWKKVQNIIQDYLTEEGLQ